MDGVVISIPQMDSLSVKLLERKWYKEKLDSNKYRFDLMMLEIENLTYQLNYKEEVIREKNLLIAEKDFQLKLTEEKSVLQKTTFWDKAKGWLIGAGIGFFTAVALML